MKQRLTSEQYQALQHFATYHGRTWKASLRHVWMTGNYPSIVKDPASLQQIRNTFGPSWLTRFRFCLACSTAEGYHSQTCNGGWGPSFKASKPAQKVIKLIDTATGEEILPGQTVTSRHSGDVFILQSFYSKPSPSTGRVVVTVNANKKDRFAETMEFYPSVIGATIIEVE